MTVVAVLVGLILSIMCVSMIAAVLVYRSVKAALREFVSSPDGEKPSPLASSVMALSAASAPLLANAVTASIVGSLKGQASGITRSLGAVETDAAESLIANSGNPLVTALGAAFQRQVKKNPMLAIAASHLLGNLGNSVVPSKSNGQATEPKFNL